MSAPLGIWIVRDEAKKLGEKLSARLSGELYLPDADASLSNREAFALAWLNHRQWIMIAATGIAVRYLQGLTNDKAVDPSVVVLDEGCRFAVSLLGGHEGGANRLAYQVANNTGAVPVITTATEALRPLVIGIGCRKNVAVDSIEAAVNRALQLASRNRQEIREVATIDLKAHEPGLIKWCATYNVHLRIISGELLRLRPWVTEASEWVRENIGVDGVCEPCALLATFRGKLVLPKFVHDGVTVAIVDDGDAE